MAFLVWNNEDDADDSLAAINGMYGCPYEAENGYKMDRWDDVRESIPAGNYGFFKPEERLGKEIGGLMLVLIPGFTEYEEMPEEFIEEDEDEDEEEEEKVALGHTEIRLNEMQAIAGLSLWLDADDADTLTKHTDGTGSSRVSEWRDKSGNDNHVTQVAAGSQPGIGMINGRNAIDFAGPPLVAPERAYDDPKPVYPFLNGNEASTQIPLSDHTIFFVSHMDTSQAGVLLCWQSNITQNREVYEFYPTHSDFHSTGMIGNKQLTPVNESLLNQDILIRISVLFFNNITTAKNGKVSSSHALTDGPIPDVDTFLIGAQKHIIENPIVNYFDGQIGEIIIYNRVLSIEEISIVESYLSGKWGITLG